MTVDKGTGPQLFVTCRSTQCTVIAVQTLGCLGVLLVHHDVQHTGRALGIILRTRVGHYLDALHGGGGHALEHHRGVGREHHVGHTIDIHLEVGRTIDGDIVLSIDGNHRHLAEHVEDGVRLGVLILGYVVAHLIDFHLHQGLLGDDLHTLQHGSTLLQIQGVEVQGILLTEGDGHLQVFFADAAEHDVELTLALHFLGEFTLLVGEEHSDGFLRLAYLKHADGGERLALA